MRGIQALIYRMHGREPPAVLPQDTFPSDEELAAGRAWMAEHMNATPAFFWDRWGPLPRKSPLMLSLLCDSAAHDGLMWFTPESWQRLWALSTSTN